LVVGLAVVVAPVVGIVVVVVVSFDEAAGRYFLIGTGPRHAAGG
jgi:hypothetical protein